MTEPDARTVLIRRLEPADWPQLKEVRLAALADAPFAFASTLEREQHYPDERWQDWLRSAPAVFCAYPTGDQRGRTSGSIAGMAAAYVRTRPAQATAEAARADSGDWHLVAMWVSPAARGQGVGDQLVDAICIRARQAGACTVTLWVTDVNRGARAFYDRLGFEPTGSRQLVRPDEPDHWETELERQLG